MVHMHMPDPPPRPAAGMLSKQRAALEGEVKRYTTGAQSTPSSRAPVLGTLHRQYTAGIQMTQSVGGLSAAPSLLPSLKHWLAVCFPTLPQATWCTRGWTTGRRAGGRCPWTRYQVQAAHHANAEAGEC